MHCIFIHKYSVILKIHVSYRYYIEGKDHSNDIQKLIILMGWDNTEK